MGQGTVHCPGCLMGNHVHLLLREGKEPLDLIFKRLGSRFVYWYNLKY